MNDLRPLTYAVTTVLFIITLVTIPMRIWVRAIAMKSFGYDDWLMSSMIIFFPCQQAMLYFFIANGGGQRFMEFIVEKPTGMMTLLKGLLAEEFIYVFMQFAIKMCFLLFFFRLSKNKVFRASLWATIVFHSVSTVGIWLLYGLQCMPLEAFYDAAKHPTVQCISPNVAYWVPYSLNLFVDVCIFILPLPTILTLQMSMHRRLMVLAVITTGGSAVLCGGLRAIILFEFINTTDFTWSLGKMIIISAIEIDMAILAANMPALKAFFRCWQQDKLGPGQGRNLVASTGAKPTSGSRSHAMELNSGLSRSKTGGGVVTVSSGARERLPSTESEEELWDLPKQRPKKAEYESSWRSGEGGSS